jgi:hypothetical protein
MFHFHVVIPPSYLTFPVSFLGYILLMLVTWAAFGLYGMVLTVLALVLIKIFNRM